MDERLQQIEWALIGHGLTHPDEFGTMAAQLSDADFPDILPRELFKGMCKLHFSGAPIDTVTLRGTIPDTDDDTWGQVVSEAMTRTCSDPGYYAQMLRDGVRLQRIRDKGSAIAYAESLEQAEAVLGELSTIAASRAAATVTTAADAAQAFFDRIGAREKPRYLDWGVPELNEKTFTEPGDFVVIGGYPNAGKTLFAIQTAAKIAEGQRVGFFSLETSDRKVTDRLMCYLSRVPLSKIKNRSLAPDDWKALTAAGQKMSDLKLDIIPASGMTVRDITAISLNNRYDVIFADYLQLIDGGAKDRYENVTNVSLQLHTLAQKHRITVIALAQLKRAEKTTGKKPLPPSMSDFRESGQIEQDADLAILLYPSDPNDNRSDRMLKIAKNKEGERALITMVFDGATQSMRPVPKSSGQKLREGLSELDRKQKAEKRQMTFEEIPTDDKEEPPF